MQKASCAGCARTSKSNPSRSRGRPGQAYCGFGFVGFRVGFRIVGSGLRVYGMGFWGLGLKGLGLSGFGLRVWSWV